MKHHYILDRNFRQGSQYKLVEWNELTPVQKDQLSGLHEEAEVYGLFRPTGIARGLTYKVAYREVATLFLHLQYSNKLPHYFIVSGSQHINNMLVRLLLDDIIQVEWEGVYRGGVSALPAIFGEDLFDESYVPTYLSDLSFKGIHYAWLLDNTDLRWIAKKLYCFNTVPWEGSVKIAFTETQEIKNFLFSGMDDNCRALLDQYWESYPLSLKNGWLSWAKRSMTTSPASKFSCKLYISPQIKDMPAVFNKFLPVISQSGSFSFKTGSTIEGLLRPDKMVAYFHSKQELLNTVRILEKELGGYSPQGVPYSTQLDQSGLLSYGEDPPVNDVLKSVDGGSWRAFVTDQLALAICQAKESKLSWPEAMRFIRARLLTEGVDNYTWTSIKESA